MPAQTEIREPHELLRTVADAISGHNAQDVAAVLEYVLACLIMQAADNDRTRAVFLLENVVVPNVVNGIRRVSENGKQPTHEATDARH